MRRNAEAYRDTEICGGAGKMADARLLLLCMQRRFTSVRFDRTCNCEKAGDVVEATGGILSLWRSSTGVILRYLSREHDLRADEVKETLEDMGTLARQCKILCAHLVWSAQDEQEAVLSAYVTIRERVRPAIQPCRGAVCPVCGGRLSE